jgi:hypothetical protein
MLHQGLPETTLYSLASEPPAQVEQRRSGERHLSLLRVGTLIVAARRELCLIRNVSAGGMMIRVYSEIGEGERLTVELKQGEPIEGVVRWAENGCIGVHFDQPVDVISLISTSLEGPRPRMPRIAVDRTAWVRPEGESRVRTRVTDISQGGVRVESTAKLATGTPVVVLIDGLAAQPAVVRWSGGGVYGVTFNRILALQDLVHWLRGEEPAAKRASS